MIYETKIRGGVARSQSFPDELSEMCSVCPKANKWITFPRTYETQSLFVRGSGDLGAYNSQATFTCRHNVTKKPICAIPCNGILEFCENDEDENCEGPGPLTVGLVTLCCASAFIAIAFALRGVALFGKGPKPFQAVLETADGHHKSFLYFTLCRLKITQDMENAKKEAKAYYSINVIGSKDQFFMDVFGTNDLSAFFYDCVNDALSTRVVHALQRRIPNFNRLCRIIHTNSICATFLCVVRIGFRYSDLSKDLLLLHIIWLQLSNYELGSFPMAIFWILLTCLMIAQIFNIFISSIYEKTLSDWHFMKRIFVILPMTPFLPAIYMFGTLVLQLQRLKLLQDGEKTDEPLGVMMKLQELETKMHRLKILSAKLKANEIVLNTLVQLTILLIICLLSLTKSRLMVNFDQLFLNKNIFLGVLVACMSFASLVIGQVNFLKANRNGCSSGLYILIPYFALGAVSRFVEIRLFGQKLIIHIWQDFGDYSSFYSIYGTI